jgi:hypothetical protein
MLLDAISERLGKLRSMIEGANRPGNHSGLFAQYICRHLHEQPVKWNVFQDADIWRGTIKRDNLVTGLAALGFQIASVGRAPELSACFAKAFHQLQERDPFPDDRATFPFHPTMFLGIALGAKCATVDSEAMMTWLQEVEKRLPQLSHEVVVDVLYEWISVELNAVAPLPIAKDPTTVLDSAAVIVAQQFGILGTLPEHFRTGLIGSFVTAEVDDTDAITSSWIYSAVVGVMESAVAALVPSKETIGLVLRRFPAAMRRWHWDDDVKWPIPNEREVQTVVFLMLTAAFGNVVDEDPLGKLGHSSYRVDFGLPSARAIVEVKYCRSRKDFKKIEQEVMVDATAYFGSVSGYDRLIVFIYDDSMSTQEYDLTSEAIRAVPNVADVVIVARPSQLPDRTFQT